MLPGDLKVVNGTFTVDLTGGSWPYDTHSHGPSLTGTTTGDTVTYYIPDGSGGWTSTGSTPPTVTDVSDGPLDVKVVVTRDGYDPAESTTTLTITVTGVNDAPVVVDEPLHMAVGQLRGIALRL